MSRDNRPPRLTFGRLSLEPLESRLNPADFYWNPVTLNADGVYSSATVQNWLKGPSVPYDRYLTSDPAPGPQDDLYFVGGVSGADCTVPQPADPAPAPYGRAFAGLHLLFGPIGPNNPDPGPPGSPPTSPPPVAYTGTVTAAGSFTVGTLEVDCGAIKQDAAGAATSGDAGTLTVKTTFDWTGGTLNSNSVAGTIVLAPGANGVAEPSFTNPGINGTVILGSDLILRGTDAISPLPSLGSTLTMRDGTYNLENGAGLRVNGFCNLNMAPIKRPLDGEIVVAGKRRTQNDKGLIEIEEGAKATVKPIERSATDKRWAEVKLTGPTPIYRNKGQTIIEDHTALRILPDEATDVGWYHQTADDGANEQPLTRLAGGCMIECTQKPYIQGFGYVTIMKGRLALSFEDDGSGEPKANQRPSEIVAPANAAAPALFVSTGAKLTTTRCTVFCTLDVTGSIKCTGGIDLFVDRSTLASDRINATKAITLKSGVVITTLQVSWCDPSAGPPILPINDQQTNVWTLLHSDDLNTGISDPPTAIYPTDPTITVTGGRQRGDQEWAAWRQ